MYNIKGKGASGGIAVGRVRIMKNNIPAQNAAKSASDEKTRFEDALKTASEQLSHLYEKAKDDAGEDAAAIFEIQQMMLEDEDFTDAVISGIENENMSAEAAVEAAGNCFSQMFAQSGDEYMSARSADVLDIARRLVRCLSGEEEAAGNGAFILAADEILPSDMIGVDKKLLLAVVTAGGSQTSHASILARSMGIPCVIGAKFDPAELTDGTLAIVDGDSGEVIFDPDGKTLAEAEKNSARQKNENTVKEKADLPFSLCVNIASPDDITSEVIEKVDGVGLFRTEFLFLGRTELPGEEEQYLAYKKALENAQGKYVTFRTLDIGADKQTAAISLAKEENPALGCRGIRVCFEHPEVFRTQLRAMLRAAVYGDMRIMYPMITSAAEFEKAKEFTAQAARELESEGTAFRIPPQGVMIETPAAVMLSDALAKEADFFSIGTNDLEQYTLAFDRQNSAPDGCYDPKHEAVMRMIALTVKNAHEAGIKVGICGELASDRGLMAAFAEIGVDSLSVSANYVGKYNKAN